MSIKGYPDRKKIDAGVNNFATVGPVREQQFGLDVIAHVFAKQVATDAAEAGSTTTGIVATGHLAQVGDVINWTSGNLDNNEYRVSEVDTNEITLCEEMSEAPAAADTFQIMRPKTPLVNDDGTLSVGVTFADDHNYGAVGAATLRTAAQIGNATGAADFGSGAIGAQTLRTAAHIGNATGAAAFGTGADSAQTLRTTLSTRHEAAATPVSARKGNGTAFDTYGSTVTGTAVPAVVTASRAKVELDTHSHSGGNVSAAAYVELIASTSAAINRVYIADTSGEPLIVAVGAAASEVDQLYLGPGHAGWIDLHIPASSRISIKSLGSTTTGGVFIFTGLS